MNTVTTMTAPTPVLGDDLKYRRIGYLIFAAVFICFGGWASLAPLDSAAVSSGVISVENSRKTIQHLEGGVVERLLIKEGQSVQVGQPLLELSGAQYKADQEQLVVAQATLMAQEARLQAERDDRTRVSYPVSRYLKAKDPRVVEAHQGQDTLFNARRQEHQGGVSVLQQKVDQANAQISGMQSIITSKQSLMASFNHEIDDLKALLAEGYVDRQRLGDYQRQVSALEGDVADLRSRIAALQSEASEAQLRMLQVQREFQSKVATELSEVQAKLADVNGRLGSADDRVLRALIKAPVAGRVFRLAVHTVGGVVTPGMPIMDIVPDNEALIVEARISPVDIDRVTAGLKASIRFTSFNRNQVPKMDGKVMEVSPDRVLDEKTGASFYIARVQINEQEYDKLKGLKLLPGMPAEVMINTGSRTMLNYLIQPITDVMSHSFKED